MYSIEIFYFDINGGDDHRDAVSVYGKENAIEAAKKYASCINTTDVDVCDMFTGELIYEYKRGTEWIAQ